MVVYKKQVKKDELNLTTDRFMGTTLQDPSANFYQNDTFVNMTESANIYNEFKIRMGDADSMTPITTARERIKFNEMNQK